MKKVTFESMAGFGMTDCPKGKTWVTMAGKEIVVMAGTFRCKQCKNHVVLPLAGKNTFGCK